MSFKRLFRRVQPLRHIISRKRRKREMWERHERFRQYVEQVKIEREAEQR